MPDKIIPLKVIRENPVHYDIIEEKIKEVFREYIYLPIIDILNLKESVLKNSLPTALEEAIRFGKIFYADGKFFGKFNAKISKELISLGAKWDGRSSAFKIEQSKIPFQIQSSISLSRAELQAKLYRIDQKLSELIPEQLASKINVASQFDTTLWDVEKQFKESVKKITVAPQLNDEQRKKVSDEWQNNLQLYFKKYVTEEEIPKLRKIVQDNAFSGIRRENLVQGFIDRYGVSQSKAKFWAHQETNLLMAKYKETKYVDAGVPEYTWGCVKMPHQSSPKSIYKPGEVRYSHGILEGKIFSWNNPPITTAPGKTEKRNNPGQDWGCRCFAKPFIRI